MAASAAIFAAGPARSRRPAATVGDPAAPTSTAPTTSSPPGEPNSRRRRPPEGLHHRRPRPRRRGALGMQLTAEELAGVVRAAQEKARYVVAHASNSLAIGQALELGVRSFEHAYELDETTAKSMARRGAFLTPTLCCTRLPHWMADHRFTPDQIERAMVVGPSHLDSIKRAVDAGVTLVGGTDYPARRAGRRHGGRRARARVPRRRGSYPPRRRFVPARSTRRVSCSPSTIWAR